MGFLFPFDVTGKQKDIALKTVNPANHPTDYGSRLLPICPYLLIFVVEIPYVMRCYSILSCFAGVMLAICPASLQGQELRNPFDFPIVLSGSFGELRANHFHSGLDFKTQGVEGKAVHAVEAGYVSRISVSPGGYGNVLYITHPSGITTVYAHLQRFAPEIAAYVKEQQYAAESFRVNLLPGPEQFPTGKGDVVAWSGNTGSSGGPHLHFEVRDTESEEVLDPLVYYRERISDTRPPRIDGIMIYPAEGKGVVNGSGRKQEFKRSAARDGGALALNGRIEAWGKIGIAVKAYDYMDGTQNIYGVKEITLKADSQVIFHSCIDRFAFDESRYLNSFIDYAEWTDNRSFYMKSFVEPGNRLRFFDTRNRGYLTIDREQTYHLQYVLADVYGHTARLSFTIEGKEQVVPLPETGAERFYRNVENHFGAKGVRLTIPYGNLYDDLYFRYAVKEDSTALAGTHLLHDRPLAFHQAARLSLRLSKDTLANKEQYGIVRIHRGRYLWTGGTYRDGWIEAPIGELGKYTVAADTVAPVITPVDQPAWKGNKRFVFRLSDNLSGVAGYRGEIDGQYALFEMDNHSVITYRFDGERLAQGAHTLRLTAADACGNETIYTYKFNY
jgi:murein DD-endopeptidase MepM/ murein hydrolase activator NlpD